MRSLEVGLSVGERPGDVMEGPLQNPIYGARLGGGHNRNHLNAVNGFLHLSVIELLSAL